MADDKTPGEASVLRGGPQMNVQEAREVAAEQGTVRGPAGAETADRDVLPRPGNNQRPSAAPPDDRPFTDSETALGGADAVQKTSYGVGHGTEPIGTDEFAPVGRKKGEGPVVARVASGGGVSPVAWVVGILALLALLIYAGGLFR